MPTGYTAAIADGITFEQFAMACARAMGACIMLRDEPSSTPIPEEFQPSPYYREALVKASDDLTRLEAMTPEQAEAEAAKAWEESEASRVKSLAGNRSLREKYEAMLAKVEAWEPPTPDHEHFREFMGDQIRESIKWDCDEDYCLTPSARLSGPEWLANAVESARLSVVLRKRSLAEEIERTNGRNAWIRALRESLKS